MMKKIKFIFVLFILIGVIFCPLKNVMAHSVELDPESLISMPFAIVSGSGTITIKSSVTDYTLYFQAVQIPSTVYSEIEKVQTDGKNELNTMEESYKALKAEVDTLKETYDTAYDAYMAGSENTELSETELETLKTAYETAKTNYQNKATEYNNKLTEYNNKVTEINAEIKELTPTYVESNWIQTTDNKISVDTTKFSGKQPYVVWAKLITSGNTYYDEDIYTMMGTATQGSTTTQGSTANSTTLDKTSTDNIESTDSSSSGNTKDTTVAVGKLPHTGKNMTILIISIVAMILVSMLIHKKYNNYKDIK